MSLRKKSKTSHPKPITDGSEEPLAGCSAIPPASGLPNDTNTSTNMPPDASAASKTLAGADKTTSAVQQPVLNKKASRKWLGGGGSWRSKAPAIVRTAKESIGVTGGATAELPDQEAEKAKEATPRKLLSKRKSSKGDAIPASITQLNVSSNGSVDQPQTAPVNEAPQNPVIEPEPKPEPESTHEPPLPPDPPRVEQTNATGTFGWRSWWSRPDGYTDNAKSNEAQAPAMTEEAQKTPLPGTTPSEEVDNIEAMERHVTTTKPQTKPDQDTVMTDAQPQSDHVAKDHIPEDTKMGDVPVVKETETKNGSAKSWFWSWSSAQNAQASPTPTSSPLDSSKIEEPNASIPQSSTTQSAELPDLPNPVDESAVTTDLNSQAPQKPSAWAFWFRDKPKNDDKNSQGAHKQVGEVAVFDTPSQSRPEAAQFNEQEEQKETNPKEPQKPPAEENASSKRSFRGFRSRATLKDTPTDFSKTATPESKSTTDLRTSDKSKTPLNAPSTQSLPQPEAPPATKVAPKPPAKTKEEPDNLIFPEFKNTYRLMQKPTYWQLIRQYFLGGENAMPHLHINPAIPRVKKAVAIGVHGYFPAPIFQRVLGQPTGTSIRFANAARTAIEDWTQARGYSAEIEQIALEGEGFIAERVNTLWKLLLNWIEHIKAADFILVACHSQGVPVAIMLVAKLIQFGCINAARVGVCAMAGVNMGPFVDYKTKYFGPTAAELFEFANPKSLVSQMYLAALEEVLRYGTRILYVGSIDDQLVSMESSTFSTLSHPYIYRAVFVDGRIHAPDFLTHLVGFTLKLRNLGLPDHGLIRELSPALAGSLYGGEGHSRVYEDPRIYRLAVEHALETTSLPISPQQQRPSTAASLTGINIPVPGAKIDSSDVYALRVKEYESTGNQNPYYLPWALRGLLEEDFVKKELGQEVEELLAMFEEWKPSSKQLKDVKFRLEGVRSKL